MDNFTASLPLMLKQLKLSTMLQQWNTLGKKAIEEQWSPQQYLSELCHIELATRDDKRLQRLLKDAKLPVGKHLSSFDFTLVDGVSKPLVADLINQPDWLKHGGNILLFAPVVLAKRISPVVLVMALSSRAIKLSLLPRQRLFNNSSKQSDIYACKMNL